MGREERLLEVQAPLDWEKVGTETWRDVFRQIIKIGIGKIVKGLIMGSEEDRTRIWNNIFRPIRQPVWWQGDDQYHPPIESEPVSELERKLRNGEFVVTAEVAPPLSINTDKFLNNIKTIKPYVTAINFTDSPSAVPRMASWACSKLAIDNGTEPVMQIAARDRTRISLQSEVIGAAALSVRNILCLSGDSMKMGPTPRGRMDVIDFDSIQMLWILRRMRDEGKYLDGREIKTPPRYFLGAAASPFSSQPKFQALREHKKVNAGAQFFQTNLVFDFQGLEIWVNEIAKRDFMDKVFLLIGITPLKSLKMARYMDKDVPGVIIPKHIIHRMEIADAKGGSQEEGIQISLELIEKVKQIKIVSGIHLMAIGWEEIVPRIIIDAGLLTKSKAPVT
jgi:methylenetetrahydrofolate reductase (NADPH)